MVEHSVGIAGAAVIFVAYLNFPLLKFLDILLKEDLLFLALYILYKQIGLI